MDTEKSSTSDEPEKAAGNDEPIHAPDPTKHENKPLPPQKPEPPPQ